MNVSWLYHSDAIPDRGLSSWRYKPATTVQFQRRIWIMELRVNAVRHIVNIIVYSFSSSSVHFSGDHARHLRWRSLFYRVSDVHGTYYYIIVSWITRGLPVHCWHARHVLYPVSQRWIISSLTVHLICTAYTVISFHAFHSYHSWSTSFSPDTTIHGFVYIVFSSSSRRGFALWASAVDAHLFCPVPDWTVTNGKPFSGLKVTNCNSCLDPTPSRGNERYSFARRATTTQGTLTFVLIVVWHIFFFSFSSLGASANCTRVPRTVREYFRIVNCNWNVFRNSELYATQQRHYNSNLYIVLACFTLCYPSHPLFFWALEG